MRINRLPLLLLLLFGASWQAVGQTPTWDTSGNGLLKGTYYFRQIYYFLSGTGNGTLADAASVYGTITFNGVAPGTYSMNLTLVDAQIGVQSGILTGTYSIAASGYGFMSNPLFPGDYIYGLVNPQGIFVASATENANYYNDMFVAAPVGSSPATAASFKGSYSVAFMDLSSGTPVSTVNGMLQMSPDGAGNLGTVGFSGYIGVNKAAQSLPNVKYIFSNGAGVLTFPTSNSAYLSGQYYLYISPDGNFVFGGSRFGYDMFVGVRAGTGTPALSGLYYQAGIDQDESQLASGYAVLDTYEGAIKANAGSIIGQQRLLELLINGIPADYTYADSYTVKPDGTYSTATMNYFVGAGGIRVGSGISPALGINVAVPGPSFTPTGVFLDPTGIVNAASSAPFTAGIAPGEMLTLYGSNLAGGVAIADQVPFSTTLGDVQVTVNGTAAPVYYVSSTQISMIVPYSLTGGIAQVQVNNNGTLSNTVSMFTSITAPGVFSDQTGLGYAKILHQDGITPVTAKSPAQIGETVSVFVTGLGPVSPAISDGAAGPVPPSTTTKTITADISGVSAKVGFSGLAPQLAGLYQVNLTIPTGLTAGDNYLDLAGPDSYTSEALIPIAGASAASESPAHSRAKVAREGGTAPARRKP